MIVLDTNVLSETLRAAPDAQVLAWLEAQPTSALFTTTITRAEILYGVRLLPKGRRRDKLQSVVLAILDEDFSGRTLAFGNSAADGYADIAAERKAKGRPISQSDAMIAAIVRAHGATLATRNTSAFTDCGIDLVDPWQATTP